MKTKYVVLFATQCIYSMAWSTYLSFVKP